MADCIRMQFMVHGEWRDWRRSRDARLAGTSWQATGNRSTLTVALSVDASGGRELSAGSLQTKKTASKTQSELEPLMAQEIRSHSIESLPGPTKRWTHSHYLNQIKLVRILESAHRWLPRSVKIK